VHASSSFDTYPDHHSLSWKTSNVASPVSSPHRAVQRGSMAVRAQRRRRRGTHGPAGRPLENVVDKLIWHLAHELCHLRCYYYTASSPGLSLDSFREEDQDARPTRTILPGLARSTTWGAGRPGPRHATMHARIIRSIDTQPRRSSSILTVRDGDTRGVESGRFWSAR
jgi:hypothetical protein